MHPHDLLARLIAFPTVSAAPNRDLIDFCAARLRNVGAEVTLVEAEGRAKANLWATIGPADVPGVVLSGHTDVVPVDGQDWTVPPFELTVRDGRLYGRGTADMKGFVAAALGAALRAAGRDLAAPLHLALSHDEEVGCLGVRPLIDRMAAMPVRPRLCIVGEPTGMAVAVGHKGKTTLRVSCTGRAGHSADAPAALNAIHMACDLVAAIRELQAELSRDAAGDADGAATTLHVGRLSAGGALNIVPDRAELALEVRNRPADDPDALVDRIRAAARRILAPLRRDFPGAAIAVEVTGRYPALRTDPGSEAVALVQALVGRTDTITVPFGTEGGLFAARLGLPTIVCGPGSMAQGHRPDEFVEADQLARCDAVLDALLDRLGAGL